MPVGLSEEQIQRIDEVVATRRKIKRGGTLFRNGEAFTSLYAIRTGFFKTCVVTEDGRDQVTGFQMAGEVIGLDGFVPELNTPEALAKQQQFYKAQLKLAQQHQLPVILHVRRSADLLLKGLRDTPVVGGIAHAFNGSLQQAQAFITMGFKLGFGGALTYDRALQLRRLATELPLSAIVLETDAPDIPPHWLYTTAEQRAAGQSQGRNEPVELPRIAQLLADLRGIPLETLAHATSANARQALPRLQ